MRLRRKRRRCQQIGKSAAKSGTTWPTALLRGVIATEGRSAPRRLGAQRRALGRHRFKGRRRRAGCARSTGSVTGEQIKGMWRRRVGRWPFALGWAGRGGGGGVIEGLILATGAADGDRERIGLVGRRLCPWVVPATRRTAAWRR